MLLLHPLVRRYRKYQTARHHGKNQCLSCLLFVEFTFTYNGSLSRYHNSNMRTITNHCGVHQYKKCVLLIARLGAGRWWLSCSNICMHLCASAVRPITINQNKVNKWIHTIYHPRRLRSDERLGCNHWTCSMANKDELSEVGDWALIAKVIVTWPATEKTSAWQRRNSSNILDWPTNGCCYEHRAT